MIKSSLRSLFVCLLLLCLWSVTIFEMPSNKLAPPMSKITEIPDGRKFNTPFPVDLVYTWVNGSDPRHKDILARFRKTLLQSKLLTTTGARSLAHSRFADNGGLRYSLRSVEKYANWIRHVFIVTNGQVPSWLNLENPRVTIVKHEEIFDNPDDLPTFSSPAIEHNIYKIRGISEKFIYMNDDNFFARAVSLEDFYTEQNGTKVSRQRTGGVFKAYALGVYEIYLATPVQAQCSRHCNTTMLGNGVCEFGCNYNHCAYDGGDCDKRPKWLLPRDNHKSHSDYTTSIYYTHAAYTKAFGQKERRYLSHGPLFIDKRVNGDMVKRFPTEIKETCSHKMRSYRDFQFGFSYSNFLIEENNRAYRYEPIIESSNVKYLDVSLNETETMEALKGLQQNIREYKFVCINDNIDYDKPAAAERANTLLRECYESFFPDPSSFEISN